MPSYELDRIDRDIVRMALRGDVDLRRYVPEVMRLCNRLRIAEPPWLEDEPTIAERVTLNRPEWPRRESTDHTRQSAGPSPNSREPTGHIPTYATASA